MPNLVRQTISKYRAQHGLSCLALAKQIDISSNQIAALETGRDVPSLYTLKRLSKFFKWSNEELGRYVSEECKAAPTGPKRLRVKA